MKKGICQFGLLVIELYPIILTGILAWTTWSWHVDLSILLGVVSLLLLIVFAFSFICKRGQFKRISTFFIEIKIPFFRYSILAQNVSIKDLKKKDCNVIFKKLLQPDHHKQTLERLRPDWGYVTFTHSTVCLAIKASGYVDISTYREIMSGGKDSLERSQKQLLGKQCKKCAQKSSCRYRRAGCRKREFSLITFRTK